jgi:hypothetical protein
MYSTLHRIGRTETVHGFRSAFSDWAHERTAHSNHVIEMCLAHSIGAKSRRTDLFTSARIDGAVGHLRHHAAEGRERKSGSVKEPDMRADRQRPSAAEQTIGELFKRAKRDEDLLLSPEQAEIWKSVETHLHNLAADPSDENVAAFEALMWLRLPTTGSGAPLKNLGWEEEIEHLLQWAHERKAQFRREGNPASKAQDQTISELSKHEIIRKLPQHRKTAIVDAVASALKARRRTPR